MGIEITSIAFRLLKIQEISIFLQYTGLIIYLSLSLIFLFKIIQFTKNISFIGRNKILAYFTFSAGSAVLGTRLIMNGLYFFAYLFFYLTMVSIAVFAIMYFNEYRIKIDLHFYFMPFISILSFSVLFSHMLYIINIRSQYYTLLLTFLFLAGNAGYIAVTAKAFKSYNKIFNSSKINGFYMVYAGIGSLASLAGLNAIKIISNGFIFAFIEKLSYIDYFYGIIMSFFVLTLFFIKFIRNISHKYSVSWWGAVFPLGVLSAGSSIVWFLTGIPAVKYFAYFYAFMALILILYAFIHISWIFISELRGN